MKPTHKTILPLLILIILFSGCAKQKQSHGLTLEEGVLNVGVEIGYPPMEYYDDNGNLVGFDIELARALADRLGLKVNFIDTAWEGILAGLETDKYDIAVNITVLPARQERHNFTKPYIDSSMTIVALKEAEIKIEQPENIAGYSVCYQGDTTAHYFAEKLMEQGVAFTVPVVCDVFLHPIRKNAKHFYGRKKMCWSKTPQRRLRRLVFCGSRAAVRRRSAYNPVIRSWFWGFRYFLFF